MTRRLISGTIDEIMGDLEGLNTLCDPIHLPVVTTDSFDVVHIMAAARATVLHLTITCSFFFWAIME